MNVIEISNLEFSYPSKVILQGLDFHLRSQEKVFLFGPSGCGKSTFLELVSGVLPIQSGKIRILNQDMNQLTDLQRDKFRSNHMGYVFQSFNLIPYLSVLENILLPLQISDYRRKKVSDPHVEARSLAHKLGIEALLKCSVLDLSVGQQQRVAVARAFIAQPELILADEPTSALDEDHRQKFIQLLLQICEEHQTAVLFVSHDRHLQKYFDRSVSFLDINKKDYILSDSL